MTSECKECREKEIVMAEMRAMLVRISQTLK